MRLWLATAVLFAIGLNLGMWYRPAPAVAAPVKVVSWLDKNKAQDKLALALPSCRRIRRDVQEYGIDAVIAEARRRGYSEAQINEARNCLKKENT